MGGMGLEDANFSVSSESISPNWLSETMIKNKIN